MAPLAIHFAVVARADFSGYINLWTLFPLIIRQLGNDIDI
jgi:hypothetical protein